MKIVKCIIITSNLLDKLGSFFMKGLLKINGAKIGKNTYVSISSRIVGKSSLVIGNDCTIKSKAKIKARNIKIGHGCILSENCYITGSEDFLLGNKSFVGKKVRINVSRNVTIGEDVGVGENSVIWTHGYFPPADKGYPITYAPVFIDDETWISTNIIILPGVSIGKGVIIGAGSVVTKSFDDNSLIAGNPAKFIKKTEEFRNQKTFIEIMSGIFENYPKVKLIDKKDYFIEYKIGRYGLYVADGVSSNFETKVLPKKSIVIFKNIEKTDIYKTKDLQWFDLSKREMTPKKTRETDFIIDVFRSYGIRLIKNYSYA